MNDDNYSSGIVRRLLDDSRERIVGDWGLTCRYWAYPNSETPRDYPSLVGKMEAVYFAHYHQHDPAGGRDE